MATKGLQLSKTTDSGISYNFHVLIKEEIHHSNNKAECHLGHYLSETDYDNGKSIISMRRFIFKQSDFTDIRDASDRTEEFYNKIKLISSDETDGTDWTTATTITTV